jgi:uncharacterized 2Fe-2S/4Fe-4S cluster protein (DUF4445 family)
MSETIRIRLRPMGVEFDIPRGTRLQDVLFSYGVEFPCGGRGKCKGCRVRALEGTLPLSPEQTRMLTPDEIKGGWRLSCQCSAETDLVLELAQWEAQILADASRFTFTPRDGFGIAVDVGTTTVVAQLLDLTTGEVLAVRTGLNPQARFGADIMSRVGYAVTEGGHAKLVEVLRAHVGKMVDELIQATPSAATGIADIVLVGNTVMHHLFCDLSLEALSHYPFESDHLQTGVFSAADLGWQIAGNPAVRFLPCIGGFVGSDILAGVLASGLHGHSFVSALIDLGTNGEIVIGHGKRMICCSTAAGPAFEGARIMMGMRASTGAISEVHVDDGALKCHVLGNVPPRGICGSGLVDAVACMLDLGLVQPGGRVADRSAYVPLCPPVRVSQTDIRELQLAKGAIAAGVRLLLQEFGASATEVRKVHLAGAFGNYINITSGQRIGLLQFSAEQIAAAGNTALQGAKMGLFLSQETFEHLAQRIEHISLSELPAFQDVYVEEMTYPS